MRVVVIGLMLVCCACSTSTSQPLPQRTITSPSYLGERQCSVRYHGAGKTTTATISSGLPGKLDIRYAAVGLADEQTKTLTAPATFTMTIDANPLESFEVELTAPTGDYVCSVTPEN